MAKSALKYKPNEIEKELIKQMIEERFFYRIVNLGDENITKEEQEMELLRVYLQEGYSLEEAEKLAKEDLEEFFKFVEEIDKQSQIKRTSN